MRSHLRSVCLSTLVMVVLCAAIAGCGSGLTIPSFTGGGLPPGDIDVGGIVVYEAADPADAALAVEPVEGAEVVMFRGKSEVGRTSTGPGGFFRFQNPSQGAYSVEVTPPAALGLLQARHQFSHRAGQQTFLTITLQPELPDSAR